MSGPYKMKGSSALGYGSQHSKGMKYASPAKNKANYSEGAQNLLKAVPNEEAYNKLSKLDKEGFDAASKKAGLPQKKSPAKDGTAHDHPHDRLKDADGNEIPASGLEGGGSQNLGGGRSRTIKKELEKK